MRRQLRKTVLFYTEGLADKNFVNSLKSKIGTSDKLKIQVKKGNGGSPDTVIKEAIKYKSNLGFDYCCVLVDEDRPITPSARREANKNEILILISKPLCIEGMLLSCISFKKHPTNSDKCKSMFEKMYKAPYRYQTSQYFDDICATIVNMDGNIPVAIQEMISLFDGSHEMYK